MLDQLKKFVGDMAGEAETMFARVTDKKTFTRVVYAVLLISRSNGSFKEDEKAALGRVIAKDFPQFKLTDILAVINEANEKLEFDVTMGTMELEAEIGKATGDAAELIARTMIFIGAADGDFDEDERRVAKHLVERMSLTPSAYNL